MMKENRLIFKEGPDRPVQFSVRPEVTEARALSQELDLTTGSNEAPKLYQALKESTGSEELDTAMNNFASRHNLLKISIYNDNDKKNPLKDSPDRAEQMIQALDALEAKLSKMTPTEQAMILARHLEIRPMNRSMGTDYIGNNLTTTFLSDHATTDSLYDNEWKYQLEWSKNQALATQKVKKMRAETGLPLQFQYEPFPAPNGFNLEHLNQAAAEYTKFLDQLGAVLKQLPIEQDTALRNENIKAIVLKNHLSGSTEEIYRNFGGEKHVVILETEQGSAPSEIKGQITNELDRLGWSVEE